MRCIYVYVYYLFLGRLLMSFTLHQLDETLFSGLFVLAKLCALFQRNIVWLIKANRLLSLSVLNKE